MAKYTHIAKGEFGITDAEHPYSRVNVDCMFHALKDLNTMGAVKLWFYLTVRLNDNDTWKLSPKECINSIGLKDDALRDAKKLLISKGYLEDLGDDCYMFNQIPIVIEKKEETETKDTTGNGDIKWDF